MDSINESRINAETAYANGQYNIALSWYEKVLETEPNDVYVLSRLGAVCVPLGKVGLAMKYFKKAIEIDPLNGDNYFNYGNACFFNREYTKAFESYVEAEKKGCSKDVLPRLYYQLAMVFGARSDMNTALIYFQKCEDVDREGEICLKTDYISEKLKIYMVIEDYDNAEKCADLLVSSDPSQFRNYMVYYSILMADTKYDEAKKVLDDAMRYSSASEEEKNSLVLQYASLYVAKGENNPEIKEESINKAISLIRNRIDRGELANKDVIDYTIALAEIFIKAEKYDSAIRLLIGIIDNDSKFTKSNEAPAIIFDDEELTKEEIENMLAEDMELIHELVQSGEIDESMVEEEYDDEWNVIRHYGDNAFDSIKKIQDERDFGKKEVNELKHTEVPEIQITRDIKEKVCFMILSCYLAMDDFVNADKYSTGLINSQNKYYNYYAKYSSTYIYGRINKDQDAVKKKYDETIAFFRNATFSDPGDNLSVIFRARLYAEMAKYEKAIELSNLMDNEDKEVIIKYVEECKSRK